MPKTNWTAKHKSHDQRQREVESVRPDKETSKDTEKGKGKGK